MPECQFLFCGTAQSLGPFSKRASLGSSRGQCKVYHSPLGLYQGQHNPAWAKTTRKTNTGTLKIILTISLLWKFPICPRGQTCRLLALFKLFEVEPGAGAWKDVHKTMCVKCRSLRCANASEICPRLAFPWTLAPVGHALSFFFLLFFSSIEFSFINFQVCRVISY